MCHMGSPRWQSITARCEYARRGAAARKADRWFRRSRKKPQLGLRVEVLPPHPDDPEFVKSLNETPGILALAMKRKQTADGKTTFEGLPFVVPGARFNEVGTDLHSCGRLLTAPPVLLLGFVLYGPWLACRWQAGNGNESRRTLYL